MSIETPSEIFLRSRQQFLRSGDLEDAAEIYLSLLNLHQHGLRVHPSDTTLAAFDLLRIEKGLISDLSPSGDLIFKVEDSDSLDETTVRGDSTADRGRNIGLEGGDIGRAKRRMDFLERSKTGRLTAEKEPKRSRMHHTPGPTTRKLAPPAAKRAKSEEEERGHVSAFEEIAQKLFPGNMVEPARLRRARNIWDYRTVGELGSVDARELWNLIR